MYWSLPALWRAAAGAHVEIDVDDDRVLVLKLEKSSSTIVCVTVCVTGVPLCMCVFMYTHTCLYTGVLGLVRPARHHPLYEVSQDAGAHAGQPQRKEAASGSHSLGYGSGMSEVEEAGPGNRFDWLRERQEMQERVCACVSVCVCARARECVFVLGVLYVAHLLQQRKDNLSNSERIT